MYLLLAIEVVFPTWLQLVPKHAADLMDTYEKLFATYKYHAHFFQHVRAWPAGTKSVPGNIGNTAMLAMVAMSIGKGRPGRRQTPGQLQCETHPQNKQVRGLLKNRSGAMGQMAFKIRLSIAFQRRASATSWPNVQEHIWYLGVFLCIMRCSGRTDKAGKVFKRHNASRCSHVVETRHTRTKKR